MLCRELSATVGTQSDRRGRERGRMNRDDCAGGEVDGRVREWGGVLQVAAHSFQLAAYMSNPNHDSVPYVGVLSQPPLPSILLCSGFPC